MMDDTIGMSDLQFKSWVRQMIRRLEEVRKMENKEDTDKLLDELIDDCKVSLQG